jgi:hypothetical protein
VALRLALFLQSVSVGYLLGNIEAGWVKDKKGHIYIEPDKAIGLVVYLIPC